MNFAAKFYTNHIRASHDFPVEKTFIEKYIDAVVNPFLNYKSMRLNSKLQPTAMIWIYNANVSINEQHPVNFM
jgi:hypothetical protein